MQNSSRHSLTHSLTSVGASNRSALPEGGLTSESKRSWGLEVTPRADFIATERPPNPPHRGFDVDVGAGAVHGNRVDDLGSKAKL